MATGPAQAPEVTYAAQCVPPAVSGLAPARGTAQVEISAPSAATVGDEVMHGRRAR